MFKDFANEHYDWEGTLWLTSVYRYVGIEKVGKASSNVAKSEAFVNLLMGRVFLVPNTLPTSKRMLQKVQAQTKWF